MPSPWWCLKFTGRGKIYIHRKGWAGGVGWFGTELKKNYKMRFNRKQQGRWWRTIMNDHGQKVERKNWCWKFALIDTLLSSLLPFPSWCEIRIHWKTALCFNFVFECKFICKFILRFICTIVIFHPLMGFLGGSNGKESAYNAGDWGLIPGSRR